MKGKWGALASLLLLVSVGLGSTGGDAAEGQVKGSPMEAQLMVDGRVVASFTEVSGLDVEVSLQQAVCPTSDGRDDDCDGIATERWEAGVRKALAQVGSAAGDLDRDGWLSSRAKHEIAMNSIRNIKAIIVQTEEVWNHPSTTLKTKHDTTKNAIGNIRALARVINEIAIDEEGVHLAQLRAMEEATASLAIYIEDWSLKTYQPGQPHYGNITLERALSTDTAAWQFFSQVLGEKAERKSISIILRDRDGSEVARYNLFECFPVAYSASIGIEKIEIAVEKVERAR